MRLKDFIAEYGIKALATACDTSPGYLYHLSTGYRKASPAMVTKIIEATGGKVRGCDLRPDLKIIFADNKGGKND